MPSCHNRHGLCSLVTPRAWGSDVVEMSNGVLLSRHQCIAMPEHMSMRHLSWLHPQHVVSSSSVTTAIRFCNLATTRAWRSAMVRTSGGNHIKRTSAPCCAAADAFQAPFKVGNSTASLVKLSCHNCHGIIQPRYSQSPKVCRGQNVWMLLFQVVHEVIQSLIICTITKSAIGSICHNNAQSDHSCIC